MIICLSKGMLCVSVFCKKLFMEKMNDLRALLKHDIQMLYSTEEQIIDALPAMAERATNPNLRDALRQHLEITKRQRERLDQIRQMLPADDEDITRYSGVLASLMGGTKDKGMDGIIEAGEKIMAENISDEVMDAAIIGACQKVEHYEIACYGTARSFAEQLGLHEVARLLEETLMEEKEADMRLTSLAESEVNMRAEMHH